MISTKNLSSFPDRHRLYQICKSISVLDAIFAEEWADRYHSFNSKWAAGEEFFELRNGQGDHVLILFLANGCVVNGMAHEYYSADKARLTQGLPVKYHEFIFGEPVLSIGTTFCIWAGDNEAWIIGDVKDFNDDWVVDYFEVDFADADAALKIVAQVYQGEVLTNDMIYTLNADFEHWQQLKDDLEEINYPFQFD
jgi:hypothetical protein